MAAKVTPVSLQEDLKEYGQEVAKELFSNNFSAFVSFLISSYRSGSRCTVENSKQQDIPKKEKKGLDNFLSTIDKHFL